MYVTFIYGKNTIFGHKHYGMDMQIGIHIKILCNYEVLLAGL